MSILLATYNYDYQFKEKEVDSVCGMHGTYRDFVGNLKQSDHFRDLGI